jgi:hypothetical protein
LQALIGHGLGQIGSVGVVDEQCVALLGQQACGGCANTLAGAGDEGDGIHGFDFTFPLRTARS